MASVLVEFVGGHLDGTRRVVPADCLTGRPIPSIKMPTGLAAGSLFDTVTYLRQVSDRRDGPYWLMYHDPRPRVSYAELVAKQACRNETV